MYPEMRLDVAMVRATAPLLCHDGDQYLFPVIESDGGEWCGALARTAALFRKSQGAPSDLEGLPTTGHARAAIAHVQEE